MKDGIDYKPLWQLITRQFTLGRHSIHGPSHWKRVEQIGLRIAEQTGADPEIVRLFSVFHDSCRMSEGHDPKHGLRGAKLAASLRGSSYEIDEARFKTLEFACIHHTDGLLSTDASIGTCWDADRLDLPRVGVIPVRGLMSTTVAKEETLFQWAMSLHM